MWRWWGGCVQGRVGVLVMMVVLVCGGVGGGGEGDTGAEARPGAGTRGSKGG